MSNSLEKLPRRGDMSVEGETKNEKHAVGVRPLQLFYIALHPYGVENKF